MHDRRKLYYYMALAMLLITFMSMGCVRVGAQSDFAVLENANLTELHVDFPAGGSYQYAERFGENLLLVRMYVPETDDAVAYLEGDGDIYYEENFCYQFDLYSPEDDAVIASMNTEEQAADFYLIDGERLLLVDYENQQIISYDARLTLLASCDVSSFRDSSDGFVYAAAEENVWYFLNYEEHSIQKAVYSDGVCALSDGTMEDYCSVIHMASPDASKLLLSVVDKETYLSSCIVADADDLSVLRSYVQEDFFWQMISDKAFLAELSDENELYFCDWFEGKAVYFTIPEDMSVTLLDGYVLAVKDTLYAVDEEEPVYNAYLYDDTGVCVSSMTLSGDTDGDGEADICMFSGPIYLEGQESVFWLMGEMSEEEESDTYLLQWKLEADSTERETAENENVKTMIVGETAPSYLTFYDSAAETPAYESPTAANAVDDWGNLADVRIRADALEEKYGISICLGSEVPEQVGNYYTDTCLDQDTLTIAMDQLETILALYPENFFSQLLYDDLRGIRIYISGTLSGDVEGLISDPGAYVEEIDHFQVMVLDAYQCWNWDYMLNHEISHMIDRSLTFRSMYQKEALFSEETWSSYNPEGFDYLYTYDGYEENAGWESYSEYFIDSYGTTFATEDRAELFGSAVSGYLNGEFYSCLFEEGSARKEKMDYYCACIRDGFDTTGWEETMAWEIY